MQTKNKYNQGTYKYSYGGPFYVIKDPKLWENATQRKRQSLKKRENWNVILAPKAWRQERMTFMLMSKYDRNLSCTTTCYKDSPIKVNYQCHCVRSNILRWMEC